MRLLRLLVVCFVLAGCEGFVTVVDPSGNPIEGAKLEALAVAPGGVTNAEGKGTFPWAVKARSTMVRVSKPGYQTVTVDRWRLVVLHPTTQP